MKNRAYIAVLLVLLVACSLSHATDSEPKGAFKEVGATLLLPAGLNINVGYWGTAQNPLLVRLSGMYYGKTRGIQADFGWAFDRDGVFRQFVAATFQNLQISTSDLLTNTLTSFLGVGPTYGINLGGFSAQAGILFGSGSQVKTTTDILGGPSTSTTSNFSASLTLQLGYTYMWE